MSSGLVVVTEVLRPVDGTVGFETFFAAHVSGLVRTLTVVCGDRETAADCVQEAFLRAHLRWERVSAYDDPLGWVRHVALNLARDVHRRRARGRAAGLRLVGELGAGTSPGPEESSDVADPVAGALAVLPPRQRAALALRYLDGLSVADIARALGISEGAVKFHLHAGRERLRPLLGERGS